MRDSISGVGDLPGGRISKDEFYEEWVLCVDRELREELGDGFEYELSPEPLFVFPHFIESAGEEALGIAYKAKYLSGHLVLSEEHDEAKWVDLSSFDPDSYFTSHYSKAIRRFQHQIMKD